MLNSEVFLQVGFLRLRLVYFRDPVGKLHFCPLKSIKSQNFWGRGDFDVPWGNVPPRSPLNSVLAIKFGIKIVYRWSLRLKSGILKLKTKCIIPFFSWLLIVLFLCILKHFSFNFIFIYINGYLKISFFLSITRLLYSFPTVF